MRKTGAGGATYVATEGEVAGVLKAADRSDWPAVVARVYAVYEASATAWKCARDARTLGLNAHQGRLAGAAIALAVFASILIKFANAPAARAARVVRHSHRRRVLVAVLMEFGGGGLIHGEERVAQLPHLAHGLVRPAVE